MHGNEGALERGEGAPKAERDEASATNDQSGNTMRGSP